MISAILILLSSLALFLVYIQATCQTILRRELNVGQLTSLVNANGLEFQLVSKRLESYDTQLDYRWARAALNCDYQALTFLLKEATKPSYQDRLLMVYSKALFLALSGMHLFKLNPKPAMMNLTVTLKYFAGVLSENVSPLEYGSAIT
jgi:hypothetical protein